MGERIVQEEQAGKERAGYGERLLAQLGQAHGCIWTLEFPGD